MESIYKNLICYNIIEVSAKNLNRENNNLINYSLITSKLFQL